MHFIVLDRFINVEDLQQESDNENVPSVLYQTFSQGWVLAWASCWKCIFPVQSLLKVPKALQSKDLNLLKNLRPRAV